MAVVVRFVINLNRIIVDMNSETGEFLVAYDMTALK